MKGELTPRDQGSGRRGIITSPQFFSQLLSLEVVEVGPLLLYYNVAILQFIQTKVS